MAYSFKGGIHPHDNKEFTHHKPIEVLKAPEKVILPMSMHIGAPCEPMVNVGDIVDMGQIIAQSSSEFSSPIHASISGKVTGIAPSLHPNGASVMSIIIENDNEDRPHSSIKPVDYKGMSAKEIIDTIKNAGIVGHGGAAFPSHIKLNSALSNVDTIIINGAECEPYITSDHRLMIERPEEMIGGILIVMQVLGAKSVKIGIELNKKNVFDKISKLISPYPEIEISPLKCKYPQGAEKQLIYALTGREVPSGKLPADAGCIVFNIDTVSAIHRSFKLGMPAIRRIVTVSGSAIANPKNLEVRIGTPLINLIEAVGGFISPPNKLLMGGPMMGNAQFSLDVPIFKGTNAILAFCKDESPIVDDQVCIRCGKCVQACPMNLLPNYMYMYSQIGDLAECKKLGTLDCIECGSCSYECPARIELVQSFRATKQRILKK